MKDQINSVIITIISFIPATIRAGIFWRISFAREFWDRERINESRVS